MTVKTVVTTSNPGEIYETAASHQQYIALMWKSREKWYTVSDVTITHNPEYPTPAIHVVAPNPGIRFTVTDADGNVLYTNVKPKE